MQYPATEALKLAGPAGAYIGSALGAGIPGMIGYSVGSDEKTPNENMGFWRPFGYGTLGSIGGGALGGLAAIGAAQAAGISPDEGATFVPLGAGLGAIGGGSLGTYMAAKQEAGLPRPPVA